MRTIISLVLGFLICSCKPIISSISDGGLIGLDASTTTPDAAQTIDAGTPVNTTDAGSVDSSVSGSGGSTGSAGSMSASGAGGAGGTSMGSSGSGGVPVDIDAGEVAGAGGSEIAGSGAGGDQVAGQGGTGDVGGQGGDLGLPQPGCGCPN